MNDGPLPLSNSQQLNSVKSFLYHVRAMMASTLPVSGTHYDDRSSLENSSLLQDIATLFENEWRTPAITAREEEQSNHSSRISVTPAPSPEPEPSPPVSPLLQQLGKSHDILGNSGSPTHMIAFTSTKHHTYALPDFLEVFEVPANTPIICYSNPVGEYNKVPRVRLREMKTGVWLAHYDFEGGEPMGLAKYNDILFVADKKRKCVYFIDLSMKDVPTPYPSLQGVGEGTFHTPTGLVVVDNKYLIVLDCGTSTRPNPCLHVFDLRYPDFPFVATRSLDGKLLKTNSNLCSLSVKNDKEKSFYIFSGNDIAPNPIVVCKLLERQSDDPRSSAKQSSMASRPQRTIDFDFQGFQKEWKRGAGVPNPISAAVHADRNLVYVSSNKTESDMPIYVCNAGTDVIDKYRSENISKRLKDLVGNDVPKHLCVCTVPSTSSPSTTSAFLSSSCSSSSSSSSSSGERADRNKESAAYLVLTLKTSTHTTICLKIN